MPHRSAHHPWLVVVAALLVREGRVLINQRPQGSWGEGRWEFPGGKLEPKESPEQALCRECREELGVEIEVGDIFEAVAHSYPDRSIVLLFYECILLEGEPRPMEGNSLRWVAADELDAVDFLPADQPILPALKELLAGEVEPAGEC